MMIVLVLVFAECVIALLPALGDSALRGEKYDSGEPDFARQHGSEDHGSNRSGVSAWRQDNAYHTIPYSFNMSGVKKMGRLALQGAPFPCSPFVRFVLGFFKQL